jgi:peptidoglycan hydrolase-like protein with peptidoglycan-binding domain
MKFLRRSAPVCIALLSIFCPALPQLSAASTAFAQNLQLRDTSADVARLQQFLNAQHDLIAQSGPGSPGNETSIFGTNTYRTVIKFQKSSGLPATGYLGPLTRVLISSQAH